MKRNTYPYLLKGVMMAILTFALEYLLFSLVDNTMLLILLVIITLLITNHILLEVTLRYKACFMQTIILLILSSGLSFYLMINGNIGSLHYSWLYWLTTALSWLVPFIYCFFRQYMDRGPRFPDYNKFFVGMSITFFIPFTAIFIYLNYINPDYFIIHQPKGYSYIPFYTTSAFIENIISDNITISTLSTYIAQYILLFLPLGYYIRLLTRDFSLIIRIICFIILCGGTEAIKIPLLHSFIMDNILYSLIGTLIGVALFAFVDYKHYQKKDQEYLHKTSFNFTYRY